MFVHGPCTLTFNLQERGRKMQRILLLGVFSALVVIGIFGAAQAIEPPLPHVFWVSASSTNPDASIDIPNYQGAEGYLEALVNGTGYGAYGYAYFEFDGEQYTDYTGGSYVLLPEFSMNSWGILKAKWINGDAGHNTVQAALVLDWAD